MTEFCLHPHYSFDRKTLYYLQRELIDLNHEEITILEMIAKHGKFEVDNLSFTRLRRSGIIVPIPVLIVKSASDFRLLIAPHSDDVALSMGGQLLVSSAQYEIINIFSTCPSSTSLAKYSFSPQQTTTYNNSEEEFYAKLIKANLCFLRYPETLDRKQPAFSSILQSNDNPLYDEIKFRLKSIITGLQPTTTYFPLSIGNHLDHTFLYLIGRDLAATGLNILFYEDQPYTEEISPHELQQQLTEKTKGLIIIDEVDITDCLEMKIELASIYKSQYNSTYLNKLRKYAFKIGNDDRAIERIWGYKR